MVIMQSKRFLLKATDIKPLVTNYGACTASDMITVHGHLVGIMYRQEPTNDNDSGWHFTAGCETQEYMEEASNVEIYDVNTIANYDPAIIPFLNAPTGSAFEREEDGEFHEMDLDLDFDLSI